MPFDKRRVYNNNGNRIDGYGPREGQKRDYKPKYRNVGNSGSLNGNSRENINPYPNTPRQEIEPKPENKSLKDEVFEIVNNDELSPDSKVIVLAIMNLANKVEHAARAIKNMASIIKKEVDNEKTEKTKN